MRRPGASDPTSGKVKLADSSLQKLLTLRERFARGIRKLYRECQRNAVGPCANDRF